MRKALTAVLVVLAGCGSARSIVTAPDRAGATHWSRVVHVTRPLDLAGPRPDGAFVLAANGRLWLLRPDGAVPPLVTAYHADGAEPYIALAPPGCFRAGTVYALRLSLPERGVAAIGADGRVRELAHIAAPGLIDGIVFDRTGTFGHRLLVTVRSGARSTVVAIGCHGRVRVITRHGPRVEGGIAVAPATFGRYAGDLIAPDELSGRIYAVTPRGRSTLVARSGLPSGQDIGVESAGFVPAPGVAALLADRLTPGNPHPGDDVILRLTGAKLAAAGVRAGDLLVATEGGARTIDVRCGRLRCRVREVAVGPTIAHAEGHIAFR